MWVKFAKSGCMSHFFESHLLLSDSYAMEYNDLTADDCMMTIASITVDSKHN